MLTIGVLDHQAGTVFLTAVAVLPMSPIAQGPGISRIVLTSESYRQQCLGCVSRPPCISGALRDGRGVPHRAVQALG